MAHKWGFLRIVQGIYLEDETIEIRGNEIFAGTGSVGGEDGCFSLEQG